MPEQEQPAEPSEPEQAWDGSRMPFTKEDLVNQNMLRTTDFQMKIIESINKAQIYSSAKRALRIAVNNYFSSTAMLSNLEKGGRGSNTFSDEQLATRLSLERDLLFSTAAFCPSDRASSDMINIQSALQSHFRFILSRTKGGTRERILNSRISMSQEVTQTRIDAPPASMQAKPEKKPFLSFLGGGKK